MKTTALDPRYKKILSRCFVVLLIVIILLGCFWLIGFRGLPVASNVNGFIRYMTKKHGFFYEITEQTNDSVTFEIKQGASDIEQALFNTFREKSAANLNVEFATGGNVTLPTPLDTFLNAGWKDEPGLILANEKNQYVKYSRGLFSNAPVNALTISTDDLLYEHNGKIQYKAPKFIVCGKITNNSNFEDIFELGVPAMITYHQNGDAKIDGPYVGMNFFIFKENHKYPDIVSFYIHPGKNRLLRVELWDLFE